MHAGDVVDGRFRIDRAAGEGGMGTVYRAIDERSGQPVALKLLRLFDPRDEARFAREAVLLQAVHHPAIVGYVAHGTHEGAPYLVMQWLVGETLAQRLARGPLGVTETLELAHTLAGGLAAMHAQGVVHRDIKPGNVVLTESGACIVDLGIARRTKDDPAITGTGAVIGTPLYMAPEQVRNARAADARADVFALGCVLHECLAGRPPFHAETALAVLARILLEPVPSIASLRPGTPADLDALVAAMLAKNPAERPPDGSALVEALARGVTLPPPAPRGISDQEARLVACVVARPDVDTLAHTISDRTPTSLEKSLTHREGVVAAALGDGTSVAIVQGESASVAVERALALARGLLPARLAIAFGRAVGDRIPVGDAIDRALALSADARPDRMALDEIAARSLEGAHRIDRSGAVATYVGPRAQEEGRPVRGRATPFVGRRRELSALVEHVEAALEERDARAMVVVGDAGLGKSRLRTELERALAERSAPVAIVGARAAAMEASSPLAMLRAIGRAAKARGLDASSAPEPASIAWRAMVADARDPADRVALSLLERAEEATRERAYVAALGAAIRSAGGELVLVLDDAHWIDGPSVATLARLLAETRDVALAIVLLGRPEAMESLAPILRGPRVATQRLAPFSARAAEELVRAIRPELDDARRAALVARAAGHPLLLEELLRAGDDAGTSETALGVIEHRIAQLPAAARKVLRAASVLGERFWASALPDIAGMHAADVDAALDQLATRELVVDAEASRYEGERELAFRHALMRDAAYAMLPPSDRALAHRIALGWLEARGEDDEWLLAAHAESAAHDDEARAAASDRWMRIARVWPSHTESLHALGHARALVTSMSIVDRDRLDEVDRAWVFQLAGGPDRKAVAERLRGILAEARARNEHARIVASLAALTWTLAGLGDVESAKQCEDEALSLVRGPRDRLSVLKGGSLRAFFAGDLDEMARQTEEVIAIADQLGRDDDVSGYLHNLGEIHLRKGRFEKARAALLRSSAIAANYRDQQLCVQLNLALLAYVDAAETGRMGPVEPIRLAIARLRAGGLAWEELTARMFLAHALARAGDPEGARAELAEVTRAAEAVGYERYLEEARDARCALDEGRTPPLSDH